MHTIFFQSCIRQNQSLLWEEKLRALVVATLAGCQVPTKPLPCSPSSTEQGDKIMLKNSWVEIRTQTSLTNYHQRQSRLSLKKIKLIYCQLRIENDTEEKRTNKKTPNQPTTPKLNKSKKTLYSKTQKKNPKPKSIFLPLPLLSRLNFTP